MHYFLLPMIPLTIAGAIFLKNRFAAYGFPVVLTSIKMFTTQVTPTYLFTALALLAIAFLTRKLNSSANISWVRVTGTAILGVFVYALVSNFGVWFFGGCEPGGERLYALNLSGLLACYKAGLPYAGVHFLKAVPSTLVLVQVVAWMKQWNVAQNVQRLLTGKASS